MSGKQRVSTFDATSTSFDAAHATMNERGLRVQVSSGREEFVLRLDGEADLATAAVLGRALVCASHESQARVVLDLADLRFIDGHCLGVISNALYLLRQDDRDLVVRSAPPMVRRLLSICEMDALVEA